MSITKLTTDGLTGTKYDTVSADNYYMEPIATTLLASNQSSIAFSNIPQGYKHLQLRFLSRDDRASTLDTILMRFNSDSGSNYYTHYLMGNGASATASGFSGTGIEVYRITGSSAGASMFGAGVLDVLDYSNVYKFKTSRSLAGADMNGSGEVVFGSGLWMNTAAITSVTLTPTNGTNFVTNTRISLYGIKG